MDCDTSVGPWNYSFDFSNVVARSWRRMRLRFGVAISRQAITPRVVSAFLKLSHDFVYRNVKVYHLRYMCCVCDLL
jgi:hypothetical protein